MNKKLKRMIKKHVGIVKSMYPELYIKVIMVIDDILVSVSSLEISEEERYEDLMYDFIKEYEREGYWDVYWGVDDTLTCDKLELLEDFVKLPEKKEKILRKENPKQSVVNF